MKKVIEYLWRWIPFILVCLSEEYLKKNKMFFVRNSDGTITSAGPGLYVLYFKDRHTKGSLTVRPIAEQQITDGNVKLKFNGLGPNTIGGWTERLIEFTLSKLWFKIITFNDPVVDQKENAGYLLHELERQAIRLQDGELYPGLSKDGSQWNKAMVCALEHFAREGKLTKSSDQLFISSITENGEYVKVTAKNLHEYLQKYHQRSLLWRILGGGEAAKVNEPETETKTETEEVIKPPLADGW